MEFALVAVVAGLLACGVIFWRMHPPERLTPILVCVLVLLAALTVGSLVYFRSFPPRTLLQHWTLSIEDRERSAIPIRPASPRLFAAMAVAAFGLVTVVACVVPVPDLSDKVPGAIRQR